MNGVTAEFDPAPEVDGSGPWGCSIIPPYLLRALAEHPDEALAEAAARSLAHDVRMRSQRAAHEHRIRTPVAPDQPGGAEAGPGPERSISDAHDRETTPGTRVRGEGDPPTGDPAADEAYAGSCHAGLQRSMYLVSCSTLCR